MSEQTLRQNVIRILKPLDAKSVENLAYPGFPDVNYIEGLIELKSKGRWPIRAASPLRLSHFTPAQRVFLRRRWELGGNAWLLLQVNTTYLLYKGFDVQEIGRTLTKAQLIKLATKTWDNLTALKADLHKCLNRKHL